MTILPRYLAGEQKTHGTGVIDPNMAHGVRTPMDSTGAGARNALRWSSPAEPARVVSSRQREFADGPARPAVVDDPNTVFGVVTAVDGDTVGSLIKPSVADADATTDLRNRIQAQLRPVGAASLGRFENDLFAADTAQTGAVPAALVTELCETYGMGIGSRTLRDLLQACAFGDSGNGDDSVVDCECFPLFVRLSSRKMGMGRQVECSGVYNSLRCACTPHVNPL